MRYGKVSLSFAVFLIGVFFINDVIAIEDVVLITKRFGRLGWDGVVHKSPMILNYNRVSPGYRMSDDESAVEQKRHDLYANLTVRQEGQYVLATVTFKNKSIQPYYIHKSRLPGENGTDFYPLCGNTFSIRADDIHLDYIGNRCQFTDNCFGELANWYEISPGEEYQFTVKLNDFYIDINTNTYAYGYVFPEGVKRYNIGSLEYSIVNEKWFIEQSMYELIFDILDFKYQYCKGDRANHVIEIHDLCSIYYSETPSVFYFERYLKDLNGNNFGDTYFEIRTNQVILNIDGGTLLSPYSKK